MLWDRKRVVWYEGMTLDPHPFQQWDRYQQGQLNARLRAVARFDWGLTRLEVDRDRLANGEFVVQRCSGVMPDGLVFELPEGDPLPAPRTVQEAFPPTRDRLAVFLTLPAERKAGGNILLQGAGNRRETRFSAETATALDENTGADERALEVARTNFQLRFGDQPLEAYVALPLGEVVRDPSGVFRLDEPFIPTCLRLSVTPHLLGIGRRLLELLVAKSTALVERHRGALAQRELTPADVLTLTMLQAVHTYLPLVNHLVATDAHPEVLYTTMLTLAGQLSVSAPEARVHPRDYPLYDHASPSACFARMDAILRELIGGAAPTANYIELPLERRRENLFVARVDRGLLQQAQFFLVARGQGLPEDRLVAELPQKLRVASPETIDAVLRSYTRALTVEHTSRLPAGMPIDQQANYFQLQKRGPFWEAIQESSGIALFVPSEISSIQLKLVAVHKP
jgi:type VI secretion system protein ImpJ